MKGLVFFGKITRYLLCKLVRFYQLFLSPFQYVLQVTVGIPCACRFRPTCSEYALQCFRKHPLPVALWLVIKRLLRCQPWCHGGYDPAP